MTPPPSALSRRATLGLAAAPLALLLSGCSRDQVEDRLDSGADRLRAPRSTPPAPANPDQPLVDDAVRAIADLRASLLPHREADPLIADLVRMHARHLQALDAASAAGSAVALGAGPLLAAVDARERALAAALVARAASAQDGDLARLLGAMSAAIAQRTAGAAA
ncbi:hypothetical protein P5P86_07955 [Nocardioides sp. BP30]|uniref:hypothetical protein n=1 Tax=Nocardioides sp. BP30 TaxID=3036374 RepID=UPI002469083A|nr:hypothetical protein [Nocardioides sp. BP30]WGL53753.1 hypothetical protein P5P86_07955 [Nocardioides sp. BP30]